MICPKCGRPVAETAVICRGCDFILDTGFLGADILDEEHQLRPGLGGVDPAVFNLADAVILGNIGDDSSSFETSDSGFHLKLDQQAARLYVSGRSQAVMSPDAIIAVIDANEGVRLTPFEKHVLRFIDGSRPVESIRRQAGLDEAEVKTALATLADKGVVKVVGRALADGVLGGDPDVDTAPGVNARKNPRRVRGTLVGAVVVVGDAADQAIDDAFRTNIRVEAPKLDDGAGPADGADVFSASSDDISSVGSEDIESFERPTDEIRARRVPSAPGVRPGSQRPAVNAARRTGHFAAPDVSDASDGFDDFGEVSNLATAVVQQPSLSDESLPPATPARRPNTGVFGAARSNMSYLDEFDSAQVEDLADSRVAPRPFIPGVTAPAPAATAARPVAEAPWSAAQTRPPTAAPAPIPSSADGSGSLNDAEKAAMTGGVWHDARSSAGPSVAPPASSRSASAGAPRAPAQPPEAGARRPPVARPAPSPRDLSTSLSDLLSESDEDLEPTAAGAQMVPSVAGRPGPSGPRATSSVQPRGPPPAPPPRVASIPVRPAAPAPALPVVSTPPRGADTSRASPLDAARPSRPAPPARAERASIPAIADPSEAVEDVATLALEHPFAGRGSVSPPAPRQVGLGAGAAPRGPAPADDDAGGAENFEGATDAVSALGTSQQPTGSLERRPGPATASTRNLDLTSPPSEDAPPAPSDSSEALDSAMVIRPAARAASLVAAAQQARALAGGAAAAFDSAAAAAAGDDDDGDFMVDPDATLNLPARPKSMEGGGRAPAPAPAPPPAADDASSRPRRAPTEDMRRKARGLFEQALKEHAAGKLGAARMNVKLATIYDPTTTEYQRILDEWEDKPRPAAATPSRPEYVELYEQAQDLEDQGDIDGALDALERGLPLAPNAAAFHNRIGVVLAMRKREFERAAAEIERAIALEPDNAHYRNNLGKVLSRANRRRDVAAGAR